MFVIGGLNVKLIRLLEEGAASLKVKQVVLPSKMTSKRVKEMPPSIVKQLVLLLETTWTSQASQALSGVGRISKTTKAAHLMKGALPLVRQIFRVKKRQS